jgi:hypothetical protein
MVRRNLCSQVQAVWYLFKPNARWSPKALVPFFWVVIHHMARNHNRKEVGMS